MTIIKHTIINLRHFIRRDKSKKDTSSRTRLAPTTITETNSTSKDKYMKGSKTTHETLFRKPVGFLIKDIRDQVAIELASTLSFSSLKHYVETNKQINQSLNQDFCGLRPLIEKLGTFKNITFNSLSKFIEQIERFENSLKKINDNNNLLLLTAKKKVEETIVKFKDVVLQKFNPNKIDYNAEFESSTPVHLAVDINDVETFKFLKDCGANINLRNEDGWTIIHRAAWKGHVNIIRELLKGLSHEERLTFLYKENENGYTPLYVAADSGCVKVINELLKDLTPEDRLTYLSKADKYKMTPLYVAVSNNNVNVIKELLKDLAPEDRLAYLHMANRYGQTPLFCAASEGYIDVINELLIGLTPKDRLAYLNKANKTGFTPLEVSSHFGEEDAARLLIEYGAKN